MGADRAILVESNVELQPLTVAKLLKAVVAKKSPDLIIMGKQAIDDDCNQTGQMLAALLNWPQATFAWKVSIADGRAVMTREIDGGLETLSMALPALITTDLRLERAALRFAAQYHEGEEKAAGNAGAGDAGGRGGTPPDHRHGAGAAATQRRRNRG